MNAIIKATRVARRRAIPPILIIFGLSGMLSMPPSMALSNAPNVITVNSTQDSADTGTGSVCTLREAVIAANTNAKVDGCVAGSSTAPDLIVFAASTNGTPFYLTVHGANEDLAATGDLDVTGGSLSIQGNGEGQTIIDGDLADRVFQVLGTASLTLSGLTVTNGQPDIAVGGGIWAESGTSLTLSSVKVSGNYAVGSSTAEGGGIQADGKLTMTNSTVSGNSALSTNNGAVFGAGLYLTGSSAVTISQSVISGNIAHSLSGTIYGGGIETQTSGSVKLTDSVISGNSAKSDGAQAFGGGMDAGAGQLTLQRVELTDNTAQGASGSVNSFGGGLSSNATTTLINTTIAGNRAVGGRGGGIYFSGNGSPADMSAFGPTIADNSAMVGGGINVEGSGQFLFVNTLIADNTATGTGPDCADGGGTGTISSNGFNLIGKSDGCTTLNPYPSDQVGTSASPLDPKLGTLQSIGGNGTRVLPLLPGSPAIDAADPNIAGSGGTCYSPDQVGTIRPKDDNGDGTAACDIGAVEYVQQPSSSGGGGGGGGGAIGMPGLLALLATVAGAVLTRRRFRAG